MDQSFESVDGIQVVFRAAGPRYCARHRASAPCPWLLNIFLGEPPKISLKLIFAEEIPIPSASLLSSRSSHSLSHDGLYPAEELTRAAPL